VTLSVNVITPSVAAASSCQVWVAMIILLRSSTSANAPAGRARTKAGKEIAVWTRATSAAEVVNVVISHDAPTSCIQVPRYEASEAIQRARNVATLSGLQGDSSVGSRAWMPA
jgi:hypothetical protein